MDNTEIYYQAFDWEGIQFPLILTGIKSITDHYKIPYESVLEIFRDENYRLIGRLTGIKSEPNDFDYYENGKIKSLGFINGETLEAESDNNTYLIQGFGFLNFSASPITKGMQTFFAFESDIYIESAKLINNNVEDSEILCDYFLCSLPSVLFNRITNRIPNSPQYKYRETLDNKGSLNLSSVYSTSWDFCILNYMEATIIIQCVHKKFLPRNIDGILIEYRNLSSNYATKTFRKTVQEYVSFILGDHLQKIGTSIFSDGYKLLTSESTQPWSRKIYRNGNVNPIPLKNSSDRDFFEKILNKLFPNFLKQYQQISLSDCLWKLWISQKQPLGTNLPILSSGLEVLVDSYLEKNNLLRTYSKSQKKLYNDLIKDELTSLEKKLNDFAFKDSIINKLKNPYNFSIGEKMRFFFNHISINFDKDSLENQALLARNLMAHQELNFATKEDQQRIKKLSDAYVSLMHRIILKIIGYNWYYIDYSKEGVKYLKMDENL